MERIDIKLSYDSLIAILQGKEFHLQKGSNHFIFHPPFDGLFVTHEQLAQLRFNDQMGILNLLNEIWEYKEKC